MKLDYYAVLGILRTASQDEIREAYKKAAFEHHPDRHPDNPKDAEARFKQIGEAYRALSNEHERALYDAYNAGEREEAPRRQRPKREARPAGRSRVARVGHNIRLKITLSALDALVGLTREITLNAPTRCGECSGSGIKRGTRAQPCDGCFGTGGAFGSCLRCRGHGFIVKDFCAACRGHGAIETARVLSVEFPPNMITGDVIKLKGHGMPSVFVDSAPGDLLIEVCIA